MGGWNKDIPMHKDVKQKISKALKGKMPKNINQLILYANKFKFKKGQIPLNKGVPMPEESKRKMIETKKNKPPKEFICSICGKKGLTKAPNRRFCDDCTKTPGAVYKEIKRYRQQPEVKAQINTYKRQYRQNPEVKKKEVKWHIQYNNRRRKRDVYFRNKMNLRRRLVRALRDYTKTGKIMHSYEYGIDYNKIIEHLMKNRPAGVSDADLGNYRRWHIDHIMPLSRFNLNDPEEVKKAFAPENHQWLTAEENMKKSDKLLDSSSLMKIKKEKKRPTRPDLF